jgi:S1-C subfamily serine protease
MLRIVQAGLATVGVLTFASNAAWSAPPTVWEIEAQCAKMNALESISVIESCTRNYLNSVYGDQWPNATEATRILGFIGGLAQRVEKGDISDAEARREISDYVSLPTEPHSAVDRAPPPALVSTPDNFAVLGMIQHGDPNRSEIVEAISAWFEDPHEPESLFPVIFALRNSPRFESKADSELSVECATADQTQCRPGLGALDNLAVSLRGSDSTATSEYVLLIVPGQIRRSKAEESETQVTSTFISDHKQVPNPQYFALQNQYESAQLQLQSAQQQFATASQMPPGFAAGYAQGLAIRQLREARELEQDIEAELESTSPTLTEDVRVPYSFTVVTTRALYQQRIGFVLVHRRSGSAWAAKYVIEAQQAFKVAQGRNQNDDQSENYPNDEEAPDRWLAEIRNMREQDFGELEWDAMPKGAFKGVRSHNLAKVALHYFVDATPDQQSATSGAHKIDRRFRSVVVVKSTAGLGAGFFISAHNVITNAHVVGTDRSVSVRLYDTADEVPGEVIAVDSRRDLALLRTSATGVAVSLLPASGDVPVGARLVIIGHPGGLEFSLTSGVVSAVRQESDSGVEVIQTDTALNPGNSGGPVFLGDKVVGVVSFKRRSSEGLGFAVHSDEIRKFLATAFLQ